LCSLGNELVLLGQMHQKGRIKPVDLSQIFLSIPAVISDRGVDAVVAHRCQEDHQRTETIAEQGNFAIALRKFANCVYRVLHVGGTSISVVGSIQTKSVLPVSLGGHTKIDPRLLPPKQIWSDGKEALFS
jgi:hypothetical protein